MSMLTIHQRFSLQLLFFFFFFNLYLYTADVKVCRQEVFFSCSSCYFFLFPFSLYLYSACRSLPYSSVFPYKSCFFFTLICIVDVKKRFSLQVLLVLLNICLLDVKAHQKPALFLTSLVNLKIAHFTVQWQAHD